MVELEIKSSIFDRRRRIIIHQDYISFDNRSSVGLEPTVFRKDEIKAFRNGIKVIEGYQFPIGRSYCIDLMNGNGKTMQIRFKTLYGINRKQLDEKYIAIINALYEFYFDELADRLVTAFNAGNTIELLDVEFNEAGVILNVKKKVGPIKWEDVATGCYRSYYALYSKSNPNNYRAFEFLKDWNTATLLTVSRVILEQKGLIRPNQ